MKRFVGFAALLAAGAAGVAAVRHVHGSGLGHEVPGGILIANTGAYDLIMRVMAGSFFDGVAADVAANSPAGGSVLEVGCGPGHLATRLAFVHRLATTGLDLDPHMIERANANAHSWSWPGDDPTDFVVGDAAALPFPDASFDTVVSTFSVHHWSDPAAGYREMVRVLRPGGKVLIWDFPTRQPHPFAPCHEHDAAEPVDYGQTGLELVDARPWRWPFRFALAERRELLPSAES